MERVAKCDCRYCNQLLLQFPKDLIAKMERKLQYPYLSIDQLKKTTIKHAQFKDELQGFFNIKFDLRSHLRQSSPTIYPSKRNSENAKTEPAQSCLPTKSIETLQETIHISSCHENKKKHHTEIMLEKISKMITKEQTFQQLSLHASPKKKKSGVIKLGDYIKQKRTSKPEIEGVFYGQIKDTSLTPERSKKLHFQLMLKKCQKLKQIYKYQNQLINIKNKNVNSQDMGIRFYTESFNTVLSKQENIQQRLGQNGKLPSKRVVQLKLSKFPDKSYLEPLLTEEKTLDIRKYKNQSVLKQRLKYVLKKNIQNAERVRYPRKSEPAKYYQKRPQQQPTDSQQVIKDKVGPWDGHQQKHDLQFQLR